jgi:hypothetical protein
LGEVLLTTDTIHKHLLYYKKGVRKWGEPIDFSGATGIEKPPHITFSAYPNPFSNKLWIRTNHPGLGQIAILDVHGRILFEGSLQEVQSIYTADWPSGLYVIKITTPRGRAWKKVIKSAN